MAYTPYLLRAADRLGLTVTEGRARQIINGRPVYLEQLLHARHAATIVHGPIDPPLDLGLEMHTLLLASVAEPAGLTGHPEIDREFHIAADEPQRIRALLEGPLGGEIAALHRASFDLRLHDAGCWVFGTSYAFYADETWLDGALRAAASIAHRMDVGRARVAPASVLTEHRKALETFARARSLAFSTTPLSVSGNLGGCPVSIRAVRTGPRTYYLSARVAFESALGIGLLLRKQGLMDDLRGLFGGQDIHVGVPAFDGRFLIRATAESSGRVPQLFDETVRAALLAVDRSWGAVAIDDEGIAVGPVPVEQPAVQVVELIDNLRMIAERIQRNLLRGAGGGGPYR